MVDVISVKMEEEEVEEEEVSRVPSKCSSISLDEEEAKCEFMSRPGHVFHLRPSIVC